MNQPARVFVVVLAGLVTAALARSASAQGRGEVTPVAGTFEAQFDSVSDNCKDTTGMNLGKATVTVAEPRRGRADVTIPMVPIMSGAVSRGGKFKAEAKRGKTAIAGVDGRFSVTGRVEGDRITFLFIAEYYAGKKPLCTQSWNATGARK